MKAILAGPCVATLVFALLSGCHRASSAPPPQAAAPTPAASISSAAATPGATQAQPTARAPDPAQALLEAAEGQRLSPAQKARVGRLEFELHRHPGAVAAAFRGLETELADEVRADAIDSAAVQACVNVAASALIAYADREADVIDALHASLNPVQRADVVSAVRLAQPGHAEAQGPGLTSERTRREGLAWLSGDLGLGPAQEQQVAAILAAQPPMPSPMREQQARVDAVFAGFVNDPFSARAIVEGPPSPADVMRRYVEREVEFLAKVLPILRPDQRELLASAIQSSRMMTEHQSSGYRP